MNRLNAKTLTSFVILSVAALALIPGGEVEAAVVRTSEPACTGFNGDTLGLCVEGCQMTADGRELSESFERLTDRFEAKVGASFQCDEPGQAGSVCFSAAENLCAGVLAETVDGFRRVENKHRSQSSECGVKLHAQCEVQKWVGKDGTVLVHTMCNDGLERCERVRGRDHDRAQLCHNNETAKIPGACNTTGR